MRQKCQGSTLAELLLATALSFSIIAVTLHYLLYIKQQNIQLENIRIAHQLLLNINQETLINHGHIAYEAVADWQNQVHQLLPTAILKVSPHGAAHYLAEITWPAHHAIHVNCQNNNPNETCTGLLI